VPARQVPQPAPDLVSYDRVSDDAADDEADLWRCIAVISLEQMDHDMRAPGATAAPDGQRELSTPPHPVPGRQHDEGSDRDAGAALAPPGGQDRAPGPGAHAQPEAVLLVAATVVRLICTLAHSRLQCGMVR
jgi:hypothetical protein